jgi:isoquinoline 1-oxidoreductase alpha subunit
MAIELKVNGAVRSIASAPDKPLLWVLREDLNLTGTKYGCGIAMCGACTVIIDGEAVRSCVIPVQAVQGKSVETIEALGANGLAPVQQAWIDHQVPQCGYCQSGFIMAAEAALRANPKITAHELEAQLSNICRCGSYDAMRAAVVQVTSAQATSARKV